MAALYRFLADAPAPLWLGLAFVAWHALGLWAGRKPQEPRGFEVKVRDGEQ